MSAPTPAPIARVRADANHVRVAADLIDASSMSGRLLRPGGPRPDLAAHPAESLSALDPRGDRVSP